MSAGAQCAGYTNFNIFAINGHGNFCSSNMRTPNQGAAILEKNVSFDRIELKSKGSLFICIRERFSLVCACAYIFFKDLLRGEAYLYYCYNNGSASDVQHVAVLFIAREKYRN